MRELHMLTGHELPPVPTQSQFICVALCHSGHVFARFAQRY
jgi:hypothetical protein